MGSRMGQPARANTRAPASKGGRQPGELKHLSTPRKRNHSPSSGERTGRSPNRPDSVVGRPMPGRGCEAREGGTAVPAEELQSLSLAEGPWKGPPQRVKAP